MVPIISSKDGNFDGQNIKDHILKISAQHRAENRALAFAFLFYDFGDYTINKILKDTDYWSSLDKISGHFLSIFYLNTQDEYYKRRNLEIYLDNERRQRMATKSEYMSYLVPVELEPTPLEKGIENLRSTLSIDKNIKQPFILFFQTADDDILDYYIVELKQEQLEKSFIELKSHIENAVSALTEVQPEYVHNYQEIFELLKQGVKNSQFIDFFDRKIKPNLNISNIVTFIQIVIGM